jgi:hypothetical protein
MKLANMRTMWPFIISLWAASQQQKLVLAQSSCDSLISTPVLVYWQEQTCEWVLGWNTAVQCTRPQGSTGKLIGDTCGAQCPEFSGCPVVNKRNTPLDFPSTSPSTRPSQSPSTRPSQSPSRKPSQSPSARPSQSPSNTPSLPPVSETPKQCCPPNFTGFKAFDDCTKYYRCQNGAISGTTACKDNLRFDETNQICDWALDVPTCEVDPCT